MALKSLLKFISSTLMLMYRIGKLTKESSRAGFITTAISEGIYDSMQCLLVYQMFRKQDNHISVFSILSNN